MNAKVKVIEILTVYMSKIVTDSANFIAIKYEIRYGFLIGIFRFDLRPY